MQDRLRVLHIGKFYHPCRGGIETYLKTLCENLNDALDLRVLVANTSPKTISETVNGVAVTRVMNIGSLSSSPITPTLLREIVKQKPDIVHLHHPNPIAELSYLLARILHRSKLVITWHSDIVRQKNLLRLYSPMLHLLLRRAHAICVATPNHISSSAFLPYYKDKCRLTTFPVNSDALQANTKTVQRLRESVGWRPIVLAVGRLVYYKGFDVLINAMQHIDACLLIIGEGELKRALNMQIKQLGLAEKVSLIEMQEDIGSYYAACDVFVLPSTRKSEAFGFVQLEAMFFGKPVVSTRLGTGVEYVNRHNETGFTVEPNSPTALANAINQLLQDKELRDRFGENARRRVLENFTTEQAAKSVLRVYEEVLGGERLTDGEH